MKRVSIRVLAGAIGLLACTAGLPTATAVAGPLTPDPATSQLLGLDYSGFSCPLQPVMAVPGVNTTLALSTATNFTNGVMLIIPSLNVRAPLPVTLGTVLQYVPVGPLRRGTIAYEIDAPPTTGSYGGSCHGIIAVGLSTNTA